MRRPCILGWLCLIILLAGGCARQVGGEFTLASQQPDGAVLAGAFDTAIYSLDGADRLTLIMLDGPESNPDRAVLIRMFWRPRSGKTPIAPSATNAMVHYAIFTGHGQSEVGVYSGAGFFFPDSKPGGIHLSGGLWDGTLRLAEGSDGFVDLLGIARFDGRVTAARDDESVRVLQRTLQKQIGNRLNLGG